MTEHLEEPCLDLSLNNQQNLSSSAALVLHEALTQVLLAGLPSARREEEGGWPPRLD